MSLQHEAPFTEEEVLEVVQLVDSILLPIHDFIAMLHGLAVAPETYRQIPSYQEQLQNLIDHFSVIHDLIPRPTYDTYFASMLLIRDQLLEAEARAPPLPEAGADGRPLFGTLQVECGPNGNVRLAIPEELVRSLMEDVGLTNAEVANVLGCSRSTLQRRMKEWGLERRQSTLNDEELFSLVVRLKTGLGLFYGERAMMGLIKAEGHWAPRWKVRALLRQIDPEGIRARWKRAIVRRTYFVPFPNSLWHIDGHHKLIRWKIVTHGGVDGKTRVVVYLKASNNNRAETVREVFLESTKSFGWPSRVRADWGGENVGVQAEMEQARGTGRGSFFAGPSTHNQRIERLWRDVFTWSIQGFYSLFTLMEEQQILNPDDGVHLWALHFIFLPRINRALARFQDTWNNHKLSTQKNKTPLELWQQGILAAAHQGFTVQLQPGTQLDDNDPDVQSHAPDFRLYGADFRGAQRERRPTDPHWDR
ncbi:hypothetical protein FRC04_009189 [Tulasnella sp. 424]|nr:hypothetical protein FRC04_009189 [Tulasnella sp. 424]